MSTQDKNEDVNQLKASIMELGNIAKDLKGQNKDFLSCEIERIRKELTAMLIRIESNE